MPELENSFYQDKVTKQKIAPLSEFLENVQSSFGSGKNGKRKSFDPYIHNNSKKERSLNDALNNIQLMREADEDEDEIDDEELDDIGDVETDSDESDIDPDMEDPDGDVNMPADTDVTNQDIDNEVDPEEGRIVDSEGEKIDGIFIGPGQRYFMGASTDPQMVIVGKISEDYVWYYAFPFKKAEKLKKDIAADLFKTGSTTWLSGSKSNDEDLKSSIESILSGRPGEKVSIDDYQFSNIQVKYTGETTGDLEPWKELEAEYDVIVDSNLTNKQTYNLRMNNKELESFRSQLQEHPVAERNFKVIRIVTEDRDYMIEAVQNPVPKTEEQDIDEVMKDYYRHLLTNNIAAGYSAEGLGAGERVIYNKEEWMVLDFVPFGDKMTVILINDATDKIVSYAAIAKIKKINEPKESKAKPKNHLGKKADGVAVDVTPKDKKIDLPVSDLKTGETQQQKALKEETDNDQRLVGALTEFIKKDPELNKNRLVPVTSNLQRKRREGSYDSNLALKGFRILVDEGARKFFNSNDGKYMGDVFSSQEQMFTSEIKNQTAQKFLEDFEANVEMGNLDQAKEEVETKVKTIADNIDDDVVAEGMETEAVAFTQPEITEIRKFENADVTTANKVGFNWDSGNNKYNVEIVKKPRTKTNDFVYSATSLKGNGEVDAERTIDSKPFIKEADIIILKDFLTQLNLNEEISEAVGGAMGTPILTSDNVVEVTNTLKTELDKIFPVASVIPSLLGGKDRPQIVIKVSLEPKEEWINKIFHNSSYGIFSLSHDGVLELYSKGRNLPKFRKSRVKSVQDVMKKINIWNQQSQSVQEEIINDRKKEMEEDMEIDEDSMTVDLTGIADKKHVKASDVHPEQLIMGIKVEMEHTSDPKVAKKIAMDHLAEFPTYYTELAKMEEKLKGQEKKKSNKKKKE